jgi:hypothetical protein
LIFSDAKLSKTAYDEGCANFWHKLAMIEKHYGHFLRDHAAIALAGLAL